MPFRPGVRILSWRKREHFLNRTTAAMQAHRMQAHRMQAPAVICARSPLAAIRTASAFAVHINSNAFQYDEYILVLLILTNAFVVCVFTFTAVRFGRPLLPHKGKCCTWMCGCTVDKRIRWFHWTIYWAIPTNQLTCPNITSHLNTFVVWFLFCLLIFILFLLKLNSNSILTRFKSLLFCCEEARCKCEFRTVT